MLAHFPSLATLEADDDAQLTVELRLAGIRAQVAVVRALADEVDDYARRGRAEGPRDQLIEEMTRLGTSLFKAAASMARESPDNDSGVFARNWPGMEGSSPESKIPDKGHQQHLDAVHAPGDLPPSLANSHS